MYIIFLMLGVTACYTVTSLSDKYAVAKEKFTGDEFTFIMCLSLSVFLLITLPFQDLRFEFSIKSFEAILLVAVCKMLEFQTSAAVLKQLSAFELKAWNYNISIYLIHFQDIFSVELEFIFMSKISSLSKNLPLVGFPSS